MNPKVKCAFCGVVIGAGAMVVNELHPTLSDKIKPHLHPDHYAYEVVPTSFVALSGSTTGYLTISNPDRDASGSSFKINLKDAYGA